MKNDELAPLEFDSLPPLDFNDNQSKPTIEKQNIIGQIFNVPGAAIRSTIQGKGYIQGALNPSEVDSFQDIFIKKAQFTTDPYMNAILGMPASAAGFALDTITNPADMATFLIPGSAPFKSTVKAIEGTKTGQFISKSVNKILTTDITPIKWIRDFWGNTKKVERVAREAKSLVLKNSKNEILSIKKAGLYKKRISSLLDKKYTEALTREEDNLKLALDMAQQKHVGKVSSEALNVSSSIRKDLPKLYKMKSEEYGNGLNNLLKNNPVNASKVEVIPSLEESLMNHGILGINESGQVFVQRSAVTKAESLILNEYVRLRGLPDDATINLGELIQSQILVKPKYNKVWGSSEHLQSEVSESLSSIIAEKSPEVAAYRKAYAPFLEWKKESNRVFRPFDGRYQNRKGKEILSKYADINKSLNKDESRLINELQGYIGKDYTKDLKSLRRTGKYISSRKSGIEGASKARGEEILRISQQRKSMIDNEIQSHIDEVLAIKDLSIDDINIETRKILDRIRARRILVGSAAAATAGASLYKYIKNRIAYQTFGLTAE